MLGIRKTNKAYRKYKYSPRIVREPRSKFSSTPGTLSKDFIEELQIYLETFTIKTTFICGDFNIDLFKC